MATILSTNERSRNGIKEFCVCYDYDTPNEQVTVSTPGTDDNVLIRGIYYFKDAAHTLTLQSASNTLLELEFDGPVGVFESLDEPLHTHKGEAFNFKCTTICKITFKYQVLA